MNNSQTRNKQTFLLRSLGLKTPFIFIKDREQFSLFPSYREINFVLIILIAGFFLSPLIVFGQQKQIDKGNMFYKDLRYSKAIPYYEEALGISPSTSVKTKLAYCYRMTNKLEKAEKLYAEIVTEKHARAITYFYFGESLMGNGNYEEAKKWFLKYAQEKPADARGALMAEACDKIKEIVPLHPDLEFKPLGINTGGDDGTPVFFENGIVFSSDSPEGKGLLKKEFEWTGRGYLQLYSGSFEADGSVENRKAFSKRINAAYKNVGSATFHAKTGKVYFSRNSDEVGRSNSYKMQIFEAILEGGRWKKVKKLGFCNNSYNYMHPSISSDGQALYFTSDRPGGQGGTDIFVSYYSKKGWSKPVNVGEGINTSYNEGFPFIHGTNTLFFASKGHTGYGGFDIFKSNLDDYGLFENAVNVGAPINSPRDDINFVYDKEGAKGMLVTSRETGNDDIYLFTVPGMNPTFTESEIEEVALVKEKSTSYYDEDLPSAKAESLDPLKAIDSEEKKSDLEIPETVEENLEEIEQSKEIADLNSLLEKSTEELEEEIDKVVEDSLPEMALEPKIEDDSLMVDKEIEEEVFSEIEEEIELVEAPEIEVIETIETSEAPEIKQSEELVQSKLILSTQSLSSSDSASIENVSLSLIDRDNKEEVTEMITDENGFAYFEILSNKGYDLVITKEGCFTTSTVIYAEEGLDSLLFSVMLDKMDRNSWYPLNVSFNENTAIMLPESEEELDALVQILRNNADVAIEIQSHLSRQKLELDKAILSQSRAETIVAYLMGHGFGEERFSAIGYGDQVLANDCEKEEDCSPEEHSNNERVGYKLIEKKELEDE